MPKTIELTRQQLYDEVWSEPMIKVAARYGISDVGLKKVCKRNSIPVPSRGYWRKIETGNKVKRLPLPKVVNERPVRFQSHDTWAANQPDTEVVARQKMMEAQPDYAITVKPTLRGSHSRVQELREKFEVAREDDYGRVTLDCLPFTVKVGPKSARRVLLILDALFNAFEQRAFEIKYFPNHYYGKTRLVVQEESFVFKITEGVTRESSAESSRKPPPQFYQPKYIFNPNGLLTLEIATWSGEGFRKKWRDKKDTPLEAQLNDFMIGLVKLADYQHAQTLIKQEEERKRQLELKRKQDIERERKREEMSRERLVREANAWEKAARVRSFIAAVEARARQEGRDLSVWLSWAATYANELDPLSTAEALDIITRRPNPPETKDVPDLAQRFSWT